MPDPSHTTWPRLDQARAAALLREQLPETKRQPLIPYGEGDFTLAFKTGSRIVRIAKHPEAALALRREACLLPRIAASLPCPVPRPSLHAPPDCPPFTLHDAITGEVLTRERWRQLPSDVQQSSAASVAAFLAALHAFPLDAAAGCDLPRLDGATFAQELHVKALPALASRFDAGTSRRLDNALARWRSPAAWEPERPALLHADIAPGHLFFNPARGNLTGVIDFGDAAIGDPARDFIFIYEDFGTAMLAAVLHHYPAAPADSLLRRIRRWYLLEALAWTLQMLATGQHDELQHGIGEICRELAGLVDV